MRHLLKTFLFLAVFYAGTSNSFANSEPLELGQEVFVKHYLNLFGEPNFTLHWALVHPKSLECMQNTDRSYHEEASFAKHAGNAALRNVKTEYLNVTPEEINAQIAALGGVLEFPIMPTHAVKFDIDHGLEDKGVCSIRYKTSLIYAYIAQLDGKWFEVKPCLTEKGRAKIAEVNKLKEENAKNLQIMYEKTQPLWSEEILKLLTEERNTVKATKLLAQEEQISEMEARGLIDLACKELVSAKK